MVDFVSYNGSLWACSQSNFSDENNIPNENSGYWSKVVTGVEGKAYVPKVINNKLTFELSGNPQSYEIELSTLKGDTGESGKSAYDIAKAIDPSIGTESE